MANLHDKKCFLANYLKPLDPSVACTTECIICIESASSPVQLPCGGKHIYCKLCIQKWLQDHNTCPMCREVLFREKRFQINWAGGMHYSLNRPPPPYDNSVAVEMEVASLLEARIAQMERRVERMMVVATMEEQEETDWNVGLLTWVSRSAEIVADGVASLLGYFGVPERTHRPSRRGSSA